MIDAEKPTDLTCIELIEKIDWACHPIGPRAGWPVALRIVLDLMLASPRSTYVVWGPERSFFFNDAYVPILGPRLPNAMGARFEDIWADAWPSVAPAFEKAEAGESTMFTDALVPMARYGEPEETWWTFSYSPICNEMGAVAGVLCLTDETTEVVRTRQALAAEQERQRGLLLQMPGFVAVLRGPDHVYEYVNDAYRAISGPRRFEERPVREVFPELAGQGFYELLDQVYGTGERYVARNLPIALDTTGQRYIDLLYEPIRGTDGTVSGIFVGGYDVTDNHTAAAALAASESHHRQILDSVTEHAVIATDLDGRITRWNEGAVRIFGWTEKEMLDETADRFFTHADRENGQIEREMSDTRERGCGEDERWHLRANGERFWADGAMLPLRGETGVLEGYVKVLRDQTEERLRVQRLELLAQASAGLLTADEPEAVIGSILRAGGEALGFDQSYSFALTADCNHLRLTHSINVDQETIDALSHASLNGPLCGIIVQTRESLILENVQHSTDPRYETSRRNGMTAYAGFPIMGTDDLYGVISFVSFTRDRFDDEALGFFATLARFLSIGHQRLEREASLSDLAMTLENRVEDRTRELMASEEALRHSQKMDAVGQLTGGVAHDFNNLLTVIRGSVDLLRRDNITPERRARYIDAIGDTADRAAKLTSQLLAFARRQALQPIVFDVGTRIGAIADMLDSITGTRVSVVTRVPDMPCVVRADPSQFETALVNMAVNARDAMRNEGTLTISLECGRSLPPIRGHGGSPGPFVAVALHDDGDGIASDDLVRIFEPFFTTKVVGKGTGLGLSQVFGFAKQSGGDVDVASEPGVGTIFTVYLPQVDIAHLTDDVEHVPVHDTEGRGACVLVVEDNVEVGRFCTQVLDDLGYKSVWVSSAEDALEKLGSDGGGFDVVFSDVVMPGIGGVELAKRLEQLLPQLPIILATGYSHVLAQEGAHGVDLLQKPYSADQLSQALRSVMRASTLD
jgi:PAS domain S-box-containing protein